MTFEAVAAAPGIPLPATGDLSIARISFAPGTVFPMFAGDLTYGLAVIEPFLAATIIDRSPGDNTLGVPDLFGTELTLEGTRR